MACRHHEIIEQRGKTLVGVCRFCGQVKEYSLNGLKPAIVKKEGRVMVDGKRGSTSITGVVRPKFTDSMREELVEIGPEEYAKRHGYEGQAVMALRRAYSLATGRKHTARRAGATKATVKLAAGKSGAMELHIYIHLLVEGGGSVGRT